MFIRRSALKVASSPLQMNSKPSSSMRPATLSAAVRGLCSVQGSPGIVMDCQKLLESVESLNERVHGPLDKTTNQSTFFPFVFLLGNHSSGKSSFVNYILNRKVQTAGVAPTDDSFTIIAPGPRDVDRDGPAFIGDPDMGFSGLKSFGPTLIHHTQLKVDVMAEGLRLMSLCVFSLSMHV